MQPLYRQCPDCKNYVAMSEVQCPICDRALPPMPTASYSGYPPTQSHHPGHLQGYLPPGSPPPPVPYRLQQQILPPIPVAEPRNKSLAGLLALLLGPFGAHGFYMGNPSMGGVMLLLTLCGIFTIFPLLPVVAIGIVQAFLYWSASDEEFYRKYVVEKRWF